MFREKMKRFIRTVLIPFAWMIWDFSGFRFFWEKLIPPKANQEDYRRPSTLILWLASFYIACYGFAAQRYEMQLNRAEFKYNTFTTQVAASVPFDYSRLEQIAAIKLPIKPNFLEPLTIYQSIWFDSVFMTYGAHEMLEGKKDTEKKLEELYLDFLHSTVSLWKQKLNESNLVNANLEKVDLSRANLEKADLSRANLDGANLAGANLCWADLSETEIGVEILTASKSYQARIDPGTEEEIRRLGLEHLIKVNNWRLDKDFF